MVRHLHVDYLLNRLGGVYRDPARVNRDASTLLQSSVGKNLQPCTLEYADNTIGKTSTVLGLQGTIAMDFRGMTYQILVDIYLVGGYPIKHPVCYVRVPNSNMYLKPNHKHVGHDGKVYIPYLHEWNAGTHNLIELVVAMSSVFSADPPVFSKPPTPAVVSPPPPPPSTISIPASNATSMNVMDTFRNSFSTMNGTGTSYCTTNGLEMSEQRQLEEMLARDALEANKAAEVARKAEREERDRNEQMQKMKEYELQRTNEYKIQLQYKIKKYVIEQERLIRNDIISDTKDQNSLNVANQKIVQQKNIYETYKEQLNRQNETVRKSIPKIKTWLEENANYMQINGEESKSSSSSSSNSEIVYDTVVGVGSTLEEQMLKLASENASLSDILYYIDRALYNDKINCIQHMKHVRSIAKKQFYTKALLLKIHQQRQMQQYNHHQNQQQLQEPPKLYGSF